MKNIILILTVFIFSTISSFSQKVIEMEYNNGVYYVPCKINDIPMKFIFDTGASNVSISLTEAMFLLKHGALKEEDLKESVKYKIANGEVQEGTKIIIREINVGGIILKDVEAGIVHQLNAPLLLGQSAISKLGKIEMDGSRLIISNSPEKKEIETNSIFFNVNFNKNYNEYGFKKSIIEQPLFSKGAYKIELKYLTNNSHFLNKYNFSDEYGVFDEYGNLFFVYAFKIGDNLKQEFIDLKNEIELKYGKPKINEEKEVLWKVGINDTVYSIKILNYVNDEMVDVLTIDYKDVRFFNDNNKKVKTDEELDFIHLKELAEQGNAKKQFELARHFEKQTDTINNFKKAYYWYSKSSEQGYPVALFNLVNLYYKGIGTEVNKKKGFKILKNLANNWNETSNKFIEDVEQSNFLNSIIEYTLAQKYEMGDGVQEDKKQAFKWYKTSATKDFVEAQYNLASIYSFGVGITKNQEQSFYWFNKCAIKGKNECQERLGYMYYTGQGTLKSIKQGIYWYTESAKQGNSEAQYVIGQLYFGGEGVEIDKNKSAYWIRKSYEDGYMEAKRFWNENQLWKHE